MYGIFTYIYHKFKPNVGVYTIHGSYGYLDPQVFAFSQDFPDLKNRGNRETIHADVATMQWPGKIR